MRKGMPLLDVYILTTDKAQPSPEVTAENYPYALWLLRSVMVSDGLTEYDFELMTLATTGPDSVVFDMLQKRHENAQADYQEVHDKLAVSMKSIVDALLGDGSGRNPVRDIRELEKAAKAAVEAEEQLELAKVMRDFVKANPAFADYGFKRAMSELHMQDFAG
jgi:hypothetical protein